MSGQRRGHFALLLATAASFALAACGETSVNAPLAAGSVATTGAVALSGAVGATLTEPIRVTVRSTDNQLLAGATVTFTVTNGGVADPSSAVTDANGVASTRWTLGRTAGANSLTATSGTATATFTATGAAAKAATVAGTTGDNQSALVGSAVTAAPSVRVLDAFNNPVEGVAVTFTVLTGGGRVIGGVARTNAAGTAAVGSWILGSAVGAQTLAARVEESGVAANPIIFSATASAGAASQSAAASVLAQSAVVGTFVAAPPSVRVTDANGNPVTGAAVAFAVTTGGGTVTGNAQLTNAQGIATVGSWLLGTVAGANTLTAVATGAGSVVFSATGTSGTAASMAISAGNNQRAQVSKAVAIAPTVVVRDQLGNAVAGTVVTFTATVGGGTVVAARQTTDASGLASVGAWFLGDTPGTNTLVASATGLTAVTFTAAADPGRPVSMTANSSIAQTAASGTAVGDSPSVIIRDAVGNPVSGVSVTFAIGSGGGTVLGSPAITNASGIATITSWTLGTTAGANSVVASAPGLPSVTFNASGTAGVAATVVGVAGFNQIGMVGSTVTTRPSVKVTDANGNAVSGATVTFAVTNGGGTGTGLVVTTDAGGFATVGSWTLGNGASNAMTATVSGNNIANNPITFTAQSATQVQLTGATIGPVAAGGTVTVTVRLTDGGGAGVALTGIPLTLSIATGTAGTFNGATATSIQSSTDVNGNATFSFIITGAAGTRSFIINGSGLGSATTAIITFN